MSRQLDNYIANSLRVRALIGFHQSIKGQLTGAIDLSDILRSSHVLAVSALDSYVHELVRIKILAIFDGVRPAVPGFAKLRIGLANFSNHPTVINARTDIEVDIRDQHSYLAFQHPTKIADAVRCVSDAKLWEEVGVILGLSAKFTKDRLELIVARRNKIAHEADIDPTFGTLWPIYAVDVLGVVDFLDALVEAIDEVVGP
jgi:hypothetical protein